MQTTTNYGLKIYEGTDLFNPLTVENVNTSDLDTIVKGVSNAAVGTATELLTGTVHALTRSDTARNVFHFTATANFEAGETFEVDGVQVTAKTPDGQNLSTGAYVINSSVLCILDGTLLTVIVNPAKALDADKLDGHDSTYFATAGDLSVLDNQVGAISSKVGTGVLDVGNDCVDGINTLNTHLSNHVIRFVRDSSQNVVLAANSTFYNFTLPKGNWLIIFDCPYCVSAGWITLSANAWAKPLHVSPNVSTSTTAHLNVNSDTAMWLSNDTIINGRLDIGIVAIKMG